MVAIKVCGVTRESDAELAVTLGAAAIGFVFWERSARSIGPAAAARIVKNVPSGVRKVGVFVNAAADWVSEMIDQVGLTTVQFHGDEPLEYCRQFSVPVFKSVSVTTSTDVRTALDLPQSTTPLVDVHDPVRRGGTGKTVDWNVAAQIARQRPIFLAGGLTPMNVADAITVVQPYGIDASSGLEAAPGVKDPDRMRAFFAAVRTVESQEHSDGAAV